MFPTNSFPLIGNGLSNDEKFRNVPSFPTWTKMETYQSNRHDDRVKYEDGENEVKVLVSLPGYSKENTEVIVDPNDCTITIELKTALEKMTEHAHKTETTTLRFRAESSRFLELDKSSCELLNGILTIIIPKKTKPDDATNKIRIL